jgi:murein DD-endopeptidase MepM/ murein hydrolase activator NlpD
MKMAVVGLKVQYQLQLVAQRLRQGRTLLGLAIALWTIGITVLFNTSTPAQLPPALQGQQQQLQQQKTQIQQEQQRIQNLEKSAQQHLTGLRKNIQATTEQIQATNDQMQQANAQLKTLEGGLAKSAIVYQKQQSAMVARLQFLQRQQRSSGWAVLLASRSLNDFLDRRYQRVLTADRAVLATLKAQTDQLAQQRSAVEQQKNQVSILTQQLLAQKAEFQNQASYQNQNISRLKTDNQALEAAMAILSQDSDKIMALIRQRVAAARSQGQAARPATVQVGSGQLGFPVDAPITSEFGWRMHPILGYEKFHAGLDFGADFGAVTRSAAAGYVIFAGWYGGYGNTVIIDHGNGITSLYGHSDGLYVEEGQSVERGAPIAIVGSTGLSTGPHLHFEVRQDGEPIDPLPYL